MFRGWCRLVELLFLYRFIKDAAFSGYITEITSKMNVKITIFSTALFPPRFVFGAYLFQIDRQTLVMTVPVCTYQCDPLDSVHGLLVILKTFLFLY